jgi:hypothetical protein
MHVKEKDYCRDQRCGPRGHHDRSSGRRGRLGGLADPTRRLQPVLGQEGLRPVLGQEGLRPVFGEEGLRPLRRQKGLQSLQSLQSLQGQEIK